MFLAILAACTDTKPEDDCATIAWFHDRDEDGYGDPDSPGDGCAPPTAAVGNADDCDDADPAVSPDATETCDGADQDCDGAVDEGAFDVGWYPDADGDGYGTGDVPSICGGAAGAAPVGGDCDDADGTVHPAAEETCDGVDQDCDEAIDEDPIDGVTWYSDADEDGFGAGDATTSCTPDAGGVLVGGDCDDADDEVYPGAEEICDGVDEDCDGAVDGPYAVPGAWPTIEDALDAAPDGEMVCVGAGTWSETLTLSGKAVSLQGMGSDLTVIDGGGVGPVVEVDGSASGSALAGLTITGGDADMGAGLFVGGAELSLADVRITGNRCVSGGCIGVGAYLNGATVTARSLSVDDNELACSADLRCYASGIYALRTTLEVDDGEAFENVATSSSVMHGGALYVASDSVVRWRGGAIWGNTIDGPGSGTYAFGAAAGVYDGGILELSNVRVADNVVSGDNNCGGALFFHTFSTGSLTNVALTGNEATCNRALGAGVAMYNQSTFSVMNGDIVGNVGSGTGGAFYFEDSSSSVTLTNTNVSSNDADAGGVVYAYSSRDVLTARYSNFYDNGATPFEGTTEPAPGDGNLGVAPLHADTSSPDSIDWDLALDPSSPLIDAGDPAILDADGSRSDVGGYGGPAGSW